MAGDFIAPRLNDIRDLRLVSLGFDSEGHEYFALPTALQSAGTGTFNLEPSEEHIGEVGGNSAVISVSPTVTASGIYAAGDSLGGKFTLVGAMRVASGSGVLNSLVIIDAGNKKPTGQIILFNADPSSSTITDGAAITVHTNDLTKIIGVIPVYSTDWYTVASNGMFNLDGIGKVVEASGSTDLYAMFNLDSAPVPTATTNYTLKFGFLRD